MASPNANYSELLSLTIQELQPELFDQILTKNALTATLKENGSVREIDGGPTIVQPIMYAENGSYKRYSGSEALNTSSNDVFTAYQYSWAQVAIAIEANGREILQNSGRSQHKNLVKSRIMNAKTTFENEFNIDLLSDGALANQVGGLQLLIADAGTGTVGGISRSTYSFARNAFYRATTDGGVAASAANIVGYMDALDVLISQYRGRTKTILADNVFYRFYEGNVHALQRLTTSNSGEPGTLGKLGYKAYAYKDAEVVLEPQVSGMPASTMYFIDPEVLELNPHADRNLTRLPLRYSFNQDAQIEYLAWMGQLTAKNFRRLGVLNND